jgi:hypothetical protein
MVNNLGSLQLNKKKGRDIISGLAVFTVGNDNSGWGFVCENP